MALTNVVNDITSALEQKDYVYGIFLDLSKAFDTVDHTILLHKLYIYGLRGKVHSWISNYLQNRLQYVSVNSTTSSSQHVVCGVPQGSILGPLLFIIYMNDITASSTKLNFTMFADDTTILYNDQNVVNGARVINTELDAVNKWLCSNKLSLNTKKTNFIIFHTIGRVIPGVEIKMNNKIIERVTETKFLGVSIHENLKWNTHINYVCSKVAMSTGVIKRLSCVFPKKILLLLYNALILPMISYANIVWGSPYNSSITNIHILQKKAVRIICKSGFRDHTPPLFHDLGIMSIFDIYQLQLGIFMYRRINNLLPQAIQFPIVYNHHVHDHCTRSASSLRNSKPRTELRKRCANYAGVKLWNTLPDHITLSDTFSIFKRRLIYCLNNRPNFVE